MTRVVPAATAQPLTLTNYVPDAPDDGASAGDIWRILGRRRGMILLTALVLAGLTLAYAKLTPPLYTASADILIDPRGQNIVANDLNPSAVAPDGGITQVESQARVVESSGVLLRVIARTHLTDDPNFNGSSRLPQRALAWCDTHLGGLLPRPRAPDEVLAATLRDLRRRLTVTRAEKVLIVSIAVTAPTPGLAAELTNATADAYLEDQAEAQRQAALRASSALAQRLDAQRARVEAAEARVEQYKKSREIVSASGQLVGDQQLIELNTQLTAASSAASSLRARLDEIDAARQSPDALAAMPDAMRSTVLATLREQEATVLRQKSDLGTMYRPDHPFITRLNVQLGTLRRLVDAEIGRIAAATRSDYEHALGTETLLRAKLDEATKASQAVGRDSVGLHELERLLDADRTVYTAFLVRAQETAEEAGIDTTNARIISRALPPSSKSWPPLGTLLVAAIGSGLALGAGLAMLREYAAPTLLSRRQIERALGAPVVGVLSPAVLARRAKAAPPWRRGAGRGLVSEGPMTPRLQSMIGLALRRLFEGAVARDKPVMGTVIVTSAAADARARRQVCGLLAAVASLNGDRVLVIDGDIGTDAPEPADGLADILGGGRQLGELIQAPPRPGVSALGKGRANWIAPSGATPGHAARLLADARARFDLVIIDAGMLADNFGIAPLLGATDELLLVARLGRTAQRDVSVVAEAAALMGRAVSAVFLVDAAARG
jgi:uncharacterized protein involved in exopolysaccharide biosynthesis/Mrp family chromosome partitioning ATPase